MQNSIEIWKDIKGFEGLYQVSNLKRIKCLSKERVNKFGKITFTKEKIIEAKKNVTLTKNKIEKRFSVDSIHNSHFLCDSENNGEIWRDVLGFEGLYQVSNLGKVKRLVREVHKNNNLTQIFPEKLIPSQKHINGYYSVHLSNGIERKRLSLHRVVGMAFLDKIPNKEEINHIDCDKSNNQLTNLEWVNRSENQSYAFKFKQKTSKYTGVCFFKNKWISNICINGKKIQIGKFNTEQEAYLARKKFEEENNIQNKYS